MRRPGAGKVTIGVQAAVTDDRGRVLLIRHTYRPGWHFPGGGVEISETLLSAVARELEEETGVAIAAPPRLFGLYSHFDAFPGDHIALFVIDRWRQARVPAPNREIAEQGFYALTELPLETTHQTRRRLDEIFGGLEPAKAW